MDTYKFRTKVLRDGIIKVPELKEFENMNVEVFIVFKPEISDTFKGRSVSDFLKKWTGFIRDIDSDNEKFDYLSSKYQ